MRRTVTPPSIFFPSQIGLQFCMLQYNYNPIFETQQICVSFGLIINVYIQMLHTLTKELTFTAEIISEEILLLYRDLRQPFLGVALTLHSKHLNHVNDYMYQQELLMIFIHLLLQTLFLFYTSRWMKILQFLQSFIF
jgi:hypothetical protein